MSKFTSILTAAVAMTVLSSATFATPILTLSYKILKQTTAGTTTQVGPAINSSSFTASAPGNFDYQLEIDGSISGLTPGNSFGSLALDVTGVIGSASRPSTAHYNYVANNPLWTNDAGDTTSATFQIAGDKGASSSDLASILAVVSQDASADSTGGGYGLDSTDPRLAMLTANGATGFKAPMKLGTFYILWDGSSNISLSMANVQFAEINDTTTLFGPTITNSANPGSVVLNTATFTGVAGPEPTSLGLLAMGGAALLVRRKKA